MLSTCLRGSQARRVRQFRHDTLPVHGIAREFSKDDLQDVIDQLSDKGLLARRTSGEYPTLYVTTKGRALLKKRESLTLVRQAPHADAAGEPDTVLFAKLRSLRHEIATELAAPAYVVFSDESLRQMAIYLPTDHKSLLQIKGVGNNKLDQFGDRFLAVIREQVAECDVGSSNPSATSEKATNGSAFAQVRNSHPRAYAQWEPEEDERLASLFQDGRSLPEIASALGRRPGAIASRLRQAGIAPGYRLPLSETETRTLELARHGLSMAEMAAQRGLSVGTVIAHLERIIEADEALELTHLLPPPDRYARIVDAFRAESNDDLLKPVKERLGDDYSYEELRLVRLRLRQLSTNIALNSATSDVLSGDKDRE